MKIVQMQSENVKRVKAVTITPAGPVVKIQGRNGQGKSSVLDSIAYALAGKNVQPPEVIRRGEDHAQVVLDLGEIIVHRRWTSNDKSYLEVKSKDGAKFASPQAMLDKLVGTLSFDPLAFMRLPPKDQVETLRKLVGLDFTELDRERQASFDHRTTVNREVKQLEARLATMPKVDVPPDPVSMDDLLAEQEMLQEVQKDNDGVRRALAVRKEGHDGNLRRVEAHKRAVALLEAQLAKAREDLNVAEGLAQGSAKDVSDLEAKVGGLKDPDLASVRERIRNAQATSDRIRQAKAREEVVHQLNAKQKSAEALSMAIANIDAGKAKALAEAKFPVPGLSFGDGGLTLNGLPLEQASSAEQLRVSLAMGLALNPQLKVLLIRDGSLLDEDSMAMVAEMAAAAEAQVWIEVVGLSGDIGVVIEDGEAVNS